MRIPKGQRRRRYEAPATFFDTLREGFLGAARRPWLTRELLASDAWRSLGINELRLVTFLLIRHMERAGRENGKLEASYRQLEAFGVCRRRLAATIRRLEEIGLIDCHHGGMRVATTYALTCYALHDGTPASDRWRAYSNPKLRPWHACRAPRMAA